MRLFSVLLTFVLIGVCFGAEPKLLSTPKGNEPTYEGKTLGEWTVRANDWDNEVRTEAATALGKIGPAAIPVLIQLFKDKDWALHRAAATALGQVGPAAISPLITLLQDKDGYVRCAAVRDPWGIRSQRKIGRSSPHEVASGQRRKHFLCCRQGFGGSQSNAHLDSRPTTSRQRRKHSHCCRQGFDGK